MKVGMSVKSQKWETAGSSTSVLLQKHTRTHTHIYSYTHTWSQNPAPSGLLAQGHGMGSMFVILAAVILGVICGN